MSSTIIGQDPAAVPGDFLAPIIETKSAWTDAWEFDPELEMISCSMHASSSSLSNLHLMRRYGDRKMPYETDFDPIPSNPRDPSGLFVRMSVVGPQGPQVQFVGVITGRSAELQGTDTIPAGQEAYVAYGGLHLLKKIEVHEALFLNADDSISRVGWIPPMNSRDLRNLLVGNAADAGGGLFLYGGTEVWTHAQYLIYLIQTFVQQDNGPRWTFAGQLEIIDGLQTTISWGTRASVADMLKELIPVKYGVDFCVRPTDDGFEIFVFALSDEDVSLANVSLPRNPNTVEVHKLKHPDLIDTRLVQTNERRVDRIEVVGKRIVVCGSLRGPSAGNGEDSGGRSLVKRWSDELEAAYKDADGKVTSPGPLDGAIDFDLARRAAKFRDVYQHLGAPNDWDLDGGAWAVKIADNGAVVTGPYQTKVRETLAYIPLKFGFDYSTFPPTDNTNGEVTPDQQPPLAWLLIPQQFLEGSQWPEDPDDPIYRPKYVSAKDVGMHVSHPFQDWGVIIDAPANHQLAFYHWSETEKYTSVINWSQFVYDYETAIATIAIESDHRIRVSYEVPAGLNAGDGSVLVVHDESAELHVLLAGTIVGVDADGKLQDSGGMDRILRDDTSRLALVACGLLSRYINERVRAQLDWRGHQPWGNLIGQIMSTIVQGENRQRIGAPITSVEWTMKPVPATIVRTGYA